MDIFSPLIEIGKMIYTPISKCVKYHRGLDESMKILQEKLEDLNVRKTDIESQIRAERRSDKNPKMEVDRWLVKVQKINDDKELEIEVAKGKFLSRARLGSRVDAKIREVEALHQEGSFSNGLMIDAIPSRGEMIPTTTTLVGKATSKKVEEIWNSLISNDVLKIGVWGMGGSGKTTIMKLIHNRVLEQDDRFDNVYWITVSKEASVFKLQDSMASALKIKDFEDAKEEVGRAGKLFAKLKEEKRYVLIFDDVWEEFNLVDVGIPEPTKDNGCKLILTTRSLEVCQRMECKDIKMELLSEDEAWNFFLEKVGRNVIMTSGLENIAKQVAKECACLPLAIVAVGSSMKGVADKHRWRTASKELRNRTKGFEGMSKVIEQLKYSYTLLNDEQAQRCLLYCALYPEDYKIQRYELIACLIVEEIIEETESRKDAFDKGHTILDKLKNACLLESSGEMWQPCVKMHDVIRDMALQIRGRESMVECGVQVVDFPEAERWKDNLETVFLMDTYIEEIHVDASPRCSMLKTLRLSRSSMLTSIPDSFFLHMPSLCILDLSRTTDIEILPNSISELENLTALVLRGSGVSYVPSLAKLQRLRVLDLCCTHKIERIPEGMKMLVNLQYLNINEIGMRKIVHLQELWSHGEVDDMDCVYEFPIGILPKLTRLQFFSALGSQYLNIKAEELMGLKKLETLGCRMSVNDFYSYQGSLPICYDVRVGNNIDNNYLEEEDESKNFKILRLSSFKVEEEGERSIVVLPNNVNEVEIYDFNHVGDESSRLPFVEGELWFNVEVLKFEMLFELRVLVDGIDRSQLQLMSHGSNGTTFSRLRQLSVYRCPKLKHLFKLELVPHFPNLESIDVIGCDEMEELVGVEEEEEESDDLSIVNDALAITFPKLRSLYLAWLPGLKSIICRKGIMVCDSIEKIDVVGCPKLKRLPLYLPLLQHNVQPSPPAALKVINVGHRCWNSLEWDNPIAKDVLQPFVEYRYS